MPIPPSTVWARNQGNTAVGNGGRGWQSQLHARVSLTPFGLAGSWCPPSFGLTAWSRPPFPASAVTSAATIIAFVPEPPVSKWTTSRIVAANAAATRAVLSGPVPHGGAQVPIRPPESSFAHGDTSCPQGVPARRVQGGCSPKKPVAETMGRVKVRPWGLFDPESPDGTEGSDERDPA